MGSAPHCCDKRGDAEGHAFGDGVGPPLRRARFGKLVAGAEDVQRAAGDRHRRSATSAAAAVTIARASRSRPAASNSSPCAEIRAALADVARRVGDSLDDRDIAARAGHLPG